MQKSMIWYKISNRLSSSSKQQGLYMWLYKKIVLELCVIATLLMQAAQSGCCAWCLSDWLLACHVLCVGLTSRIPLCRRILLSGRVLLPRGRVLLPWGILLSWWILLWRCTSGLDDNGCSLLLVLHGYSFLFFLHQGTQRTAQDRHEVTTPTSIDTTPVTNLTALHRLEDARGKW